MVDTPASYSGGLELDSRPGDWLPWLKVFVDFVQKKWWENAFKYVRFGVPSAVNMKMVLWDMTQCSLVDRYNISEEPAATILKVFTLKYSSNSSFFSFTIHVIIFPLDAI
jgi:hypothetical protein